jgi:hypothetical protein
MTEMQNARALAGDTGQIERTDHMVARNSTFSIGEVFELLAEASAVGAAKSRDSHDIFMAISEVQAALMTFQTDRSSDELQAVVTAARRLSEVLNGEPGDLLEASNIDFCAEARIARGMASAPELPSLAQMMGGAA